VINNLNAGGSTAGGTGIETAFKLAKQHFIPKGINRVIIATDGDFNVGKSSDLDMRRLISHYHGWGIYLTCIGVGTGNYKDSKLETLARWGQGNFAYLDNEMEAKRIFSSTYEATMVPLALNARLKVIFNPNIVQSYRLIGYEKRMDGLKNDSLLKEPGGEIGSGQRILACYELIPSSGFYEKGKTRFGHKKWIVSKEGASLATVILQYQSIEDTAETVAIKKIPLQVMPFEETTDSWQFGASVTLFGMLLRHSEHVGEGNFDMAEKMARRAKNAVSKDDYKDYIKLVKKAAQQPYNNGHIN
jgi:Ca-activated chloride channel family protein